MRGSCVAGRLALGVLVVASVGCEPRPSPVKHFPITSRHATDLPPRGASLHVMSRDPEVQRTMVQWLEQHGYRIVSEEGTNVLLLGEVVDQPAIGPGVTPEILIRLQYSPGMAPVILGRAMMPNAIRREDGVLRALTCQALATAWG